MTVGNLYPPNHLGGYELMWQAAVEGLRAAGHDVSVLSVHSGLRWYWRDHRWPRMAPWTVRSIERHNREAFARATVDADLVSFWSMGGLSLSLLSMFSPALAVVHDDWPLYGPRADRAFRGELELPPAVWVSDFIRRGRPGPVVSSGYDSAIFTPAPPPEPWRGRFLLPGRLDRRKGHMVALHAMTLGPEISSLVVVGGGDRGFAEELRAFAGRRLTDRVVLRGPVDPPALRDEYAAADAVLFPVVWDEPWGLVPLEAMAVGRPVVATGRGGSAEYLRHEENCLLSDAGDAEGLRAAAQRLAGDPQLREHLRQGGFATAKRHTLSRFVERMVEAHEEAARRGP